MGGSSGQVIGHKYYTNLLLFIGNRIESLLGINFDKRGWMKGSRVSVGDNGELIYLHSPYLYGENEGGVSGTLCLKHGTNNQLPDASYKKYMESIGLPASGYPYQSYISFSGGELLENLNTLTQEQLQDLADQYNDGVVQGQGFYVGNSGYMKEMLLWPKRIHVRNDGREQWYDLKSEIREILDGDSYIRKYMPATNGEYTIVYKHSNGETLSHQMSQFPLTFMSGINYSDGGASSITAYVKSAPTLVYKLSGTITTSNAYGINEVNSVLSVIGALSSQIKFIRRSGSLIYDFELLATPDTTTGNIGVRASEPSSGGGLIVNYAIFPWSGKAFGDNSGDINPIHKIREIFIDDTAMNKPEASVNDENFIKAADRIFDEGLGISWSITEKSCMDAINELCYHIEAGIRVNRQTGLYEMVLFRDDWFGEDEIHTISENKIKKGSMQYEVTNADEVINQVNVNYYDRANIKNSSFSISESGLIQTLGRVNAETVDFPYFMNMRNAEIVANWKLKILSTGVLKGSFTTGWREARKWNRYDLIRLPWSKRWVEPILVRIMNIKLGGPTSNEVSIEWVEVVPSTGMMNTTIVADDPVDTQPEAPKPCNAKVFELPYFEAVQAFGEREVGIELADNPEVGYLCAIAEKPQNNSLNAALYADSGNGFERVATVNYCETAYLDQSIDRISNSFVVKNVGNIASVRIGSQIFINDETMVYQSYDTETKVLTVKRGAFGVPQIHAANSILYFADDFIGVDQALYVDGEIIGAKVLTTTPSGVLSLDDAATHEVEFSARAIRPYPPANVKVNAEYWPVAVEGDLELTWVDRNRVQQTGGEIIGWYEGGVTRETGVKYVVEVYDNQTNTLLASQLDIDANNVTVSSTVFEYENRVELYSIRDTYQSLQRFVHVFNWGAEKWTPNLSSAKIFMLADDLSLGSVSAWKDRKTGVDFVQSINAKRPIAVSFSTFKAVKFDAVDDCLATTDTNICAVMSNKSNGWIFAVYRYDGTSSDIGTNYKNICRFSVSAALQGIFTLYASSPSAPYKPTTGTRRIGTNTAQFCSATSGTSSDGFKFVLSEADYTGQTFKTWVNAVNENTISTSFGSGVTGVIGDVNIGGHATANETIKGEICALIVGNEPLTTTERQKLEGWAAWKYNLQANLPAGHPFKDRAPTVED